MPLPFDLPTLSRGFAELTGAAARAGEAAAASAAAALSSLLGAPVSIPARAAPGLPASRPAVARLGLELAALPASAVMEVDPSWVVRVVDLLAGGPGAPEAASALTPVEASALELLALAALDGACAIPELEDRLAPRLARGVREPASALAVELEVAVREVRGRARLLLPPAAVRALGGAAPDLDASGLRVPASFRRGSAGLSLDELDALAPGDLVVLDAPSGPDALVLPGGARATGRLADDDTFHVEEMMTERRLQLPVALEVELARVEMTLGDLARLEPGAALPLALDRRGIVTLRVAERLIGRGELVEIDGAVGVRVLSVEVEP
jgi:type III secretion protein Q